MGSGYGKTVIDGVIQYLSPSGLNSGDPTQEGGCLRRWVYKYVMGMKEPFTGAQKLGVDTHKEMEHYQLTGERTLGRLALSAKAFIPDPKPGLYLVEHKMEPGDLTVAGIRAVGEIDLVRPFDPTTRENFSISELGELLADPLGTVEVKDWKTSKNVDRYSKTPQQLVKTNQMPFYGMWAFSKFPDAEHVRLSHVYMQTAGRPKSKKITILMGREKLSRRWEQIESAARTLIDIAGETDINKVPGNLHACDAWRGCPHRLYCPKTAAQTTAGIFGISRSKQIKGEKIVNIQEQIQQLSAGAAAPAAVATPVATPVAVPAAAPAPAVDMTSFKAAVSAIEALGKGFPPLAGAEAQAYISLKGIATHPRATRYEVPLSDGTKYGVTVTPEKTIEGEGEFGSFQAALTFEQFIKLGGQVAAPAPAAPTVSTTPAPTVSTTPAPTEAAVSLGLVPQGTPESSPATAAVPLETPPQETPPQETPPQGTPVQPATPPEATTQENLPHPTLVHVSDVVAKAIAADDANRWGTVKKPDIARAFSEVRAQLEQALAMIKAGAPTSQAPVATTEAPESLTLYINAIPSCPFDRLDEYVRGCCESLEKITGDKDIRSSANELLSFGKWKGALAATVRENALEPGVYYIDTKGSEINEVVAATLCEAAGIYAKGNG